MIFFKKGLVVILGGGLFFVIVALFSINIAQAVNGGPGGVSCDTCCKNGNTCSTGQICDSSDATCHTLGCSPACGCGYTCQSQCSILNGGCYTCVVDNTQSCGYTDTWYVGSWGACSSNTCGVSGTQTRTVECGQSGTGNCDPSTQPASTQSCSGSCGTTYYSCQGNLGCQEDDSCTSATGNCSTSSNCNSSCTTASSCSPDIGFGAYIYTWPQGYHTVSPPFPTSGNFSNGNTGSIQLYVQVTPSSPSTPWGSTITGTCPNGATCGFNLDRTNKPYTMVWNTFNGVAANDSMQYNIVPGPSTVSGDYIIGFSIQDSNSNNCGVGYNQKVTINGLPSYSASCTMTAPSTVTAGVPFTATVTMTNTGSNTWTPGASYNLGSYDSSTAPWTTVWNPGRWVMPAGTSVAPGQSYTFSNISVTPPSTPGVYPNFGFLMVQDGVTWFPSSSACIQSMTVNPSVADTATFSATVWNSAARNTVWTGYAGNTGNYFLNNPGPNLVVTAGLPFALNWTSNTASCTIDGVPENPASGGSDNTFTAGANGWSHTYKLIRGTVSKTLTVSVPPAPSGAVASCVANGNGTDTLSMNWNLPGGYTYSYVRLYDNGPASSNNPPWSGNPVPGMYVDDYNSGTSISSASTGSAIVPGDRYFYWIHTEDFASVGHPWSNEDPPLTWTTDYVDCPNPGPSGTFTANPTIVPSGGTSGLTWTCTNSTSGTNSISSSPNVDSWNNLANASAPNLTTSPITQNVTYTLTCNGPGGQFTKSVLITMAPGDVCTGVCGCSGGVCPGNGSGSPNSTVVVAQASCPAAGIVVQWPTAGGAVSYNIYRNISNTAPGAIYTNVPQSGSGVQTWTDNSTGGPYYYWVQSVAGSGQTSLDKVAANTNAASGISMNICGPATPTGGGSCNSGGGSVCPGGVGNPACTYVRLTWTDNSNNETGFKIYEDGIYKVTAPASVPASLTGEELYYDYQPSDNNPHSYSIAATNASGDSSLVAETGGTIASLVCAPNLFGSDKEIIAVNGSPITGISSQMCNAQSDPLPSYVSVQAGDTLTFSIDICNNGSATASSISIIDHLVNLQKAGANWNMCYNTAPATRASCQAINDASISVFGTVPNQTLSFNLGGVTVPAGSAVYVVFNAQIPPSSGNSSHLFQNTAHISYGANPPVDVFTPLQQFLNGGSVPVIKERP